MGKEEDEVATSSSSSESPREEVLLLNEEGVDDENVVLDMPVDDALEGETEEKPLLYMVVMPEVDDDPVEEEFKADVNTVTILPLGDDTAKVVDYSVSKTIPKGKRKRAPLPGIVIAKVPWLVCLIVLVVVMFTALTSFADTSPTLGSQGVFTPRNDPIVKKYNAAINLRSNDDAADPDTVFEPQSQLAAVFTLSLFYETKYDQNIFTEEYLRDIRDMEFRLMNHSRMSDFCWKIGGECVKPMSPTVDFFPAPNYTFDSNITGILQSWAHDYDEYSFFVNRGFSKDFLFSDISRTNFWFGLPIANYSSPGESGAWDSAGDVDSVYEAQRDLFTDYMEDLKKDLLKGFREDRTVNVYYMTPVLIWDEIEEMIIHDLMFGVYSAAGVLVVMYAQTFSIMLTVCGILHILAAWPVAYFIYLFVFQRDVFPMMNQMALFVILGIGADDVFVVTDAWKQSWLMGPEVTQTKAHQTGWVLYRSAKTMLVTTVTTFAAFVSTSLSPIPSIAAFGLFASAIVFSNFILVITWYPAIVVIWSRFFEHRRFCRPIPIPKPREVGEDEDPNEELDVSSFRLIERFFYSTWGPLIYRLRWPILFVFLLVFIAGVVGSAHLAPPDEEPSSFPEDSNLGNVFELIIKEFAISEDSWTASIYLVWGVKEPYLDMSGLDPNDNDHVGKIEYDPSFNIESAGCQEAVLQTCAGVVDKGLSIGTNETILFPRFREWWLHESNETGATWPIVPASEFRRALQLFKKTPDFFSNFKSQIGMTNGTVNWLSIVINATVPFDASGPELRDDFDRWEAYIDARNAASPADCNNAYQASQSWVWMRAAELYVKVAINSISIALAIAFVVLVLSTGNPVIATMATATIVVVLVTVLSLMVLLGWGLASIESICVTVLVGMAVDYVVHYANHYRESAATKRYPRMREAFLTMGVSVSGGAVTTMLACFFLFWTYFLFFKRFGQFVLMTIAVSYVYSNTLFASMMMTCGPEKKWCDVRFATFWVAKRVCCFPCWIVRRMRAKAKLAKRLAGDAGWKEAAAEEENVAPSVVEMHAVDGLEISESQSRSSEESESEDLFQTSRSSGESESRKIVRRPPRSSYSSESRSDASRSSRSSLDSGSGEHISRVVRSARSENSASFMSSELSMDEL